MGHRRQPSTTQWRIYPGMEKRISLECRGKEASQVTELNLDNVRTVGEFEGLTEEFSNLEKLSVVKAGLTSFKGFPKLPNLRKLDVSENRISSGLSTLKHCPNLTHLCLSSNKFKDISALEPLKSLEHLTNLEVANNPFSESDEVRSRIFSMLPNLDLLDNQDKEGNEASEDEDENEVINGVNHVANHNEDEVEDGDDEEDVDDEDLEEEEEDEDSEEEEDGPGLADLYNNPNLNDEDDGDYDESGQLEEEEDILDEEDEEEEAESTRGKKRKFDEEGTE